MNKKKRFTGNLSKE